MAIRGSHSGHHCARCRHSGPGHHLAPFWFVSSPTGCAEQIWWYMQYSFGVWLCKWAKPFLTNVLWDWWLLWVACALDKAVDRSMLLVGGRFLLTTSWELLDVWLVWLASPSCYENDVGSMVPSVTCASWYDSRDLSYVWCEWLVPFVDKVSLVLFRVWLAWLAFQQHCLVAFSRGALYLKFARLFYYKNRSQVDRLLLFAIVCFFSGLMRVSSLMRVCVRAQSEVLGLRLYVFCRLISGYPGECCSTQCCCVLIWAHQFQKKQTNKTHLTGSCVPRQAMLLWHLIC